MKSLLIITSVIFSFFFSNRNTLSHNEVVEKAIKARALVLSGNSNVSIKERKTFSSVKGKTSELIIFKMANEEITSIIITNDHDLIKRSLGNKSYGTLQAQVPYELHCQGVCRHCQVTLDIQTNTAMCLCNGNPSGTSCNMTITIPE